MKRGSRTLRALKWVGTVICLLIVLAFTLNAWWSFGWISSDLRGFEVICGVVKLHLERVDVASLPYEISIDTGWRFFRNYSRYGYFWWIIRPRAGLGNTIGIPLWMPFVVFAIPAAILWYRDNIRYLNMRRRVVEILTPRRPVRISGRAVIVFCVLHVAAVAVVMWLCVTLADRYGRSLDDHALDYFVMTGLVTLLWGTPMFGYLEARAFKSFRNRLFRLRCRHRCQSCGYDLTGNESGICPECGKELACHESD